jgi:hypothetical protein
MVGAWGAPLYIITAWDKTSETIVRASSARAALGIARDFVHQGKRISIVRTADGEVLAFNELQIDAGDAKRS